ncbi:hypothetical protein FKM82_023592 [Ascaphus truei]
MNKTSSFSHRSGFLQTSHQRAEPCLCPAQSKLDLCPTQSPPPLSLLLHHQLPLSRSLSLSLFNRQRISARAAKSGFPWPPASAPLCANPPSCDLALPPHAGSLLQAGAAGHGLKTEQKPGGRGGEQLRDEGATADAFRSLSRHGAAK